MMNSKRVYIISMTLIVLLFQNCSNQKESLLTSDTESKRHADNTYKDFPDSIPSPTSQDEGATDSFDASSELTDASQVDYSQNQFSIVNKGNVYSPFLLNQNGKLKMYFGGWVESGQINDNIYLADCNADGTSCDNVRSVINPLDSDVIHLNDPTIIVHPGGYYIMFMTVLKTGGYDVVDDHHIYFSTSWQNDGVNWSQPQPLLEGYWLPSTVINGEGEIELFAYGAPGSGNDFLTKFNMGESGISPRAVGPVGILNNLTGDVVGLANAHVIFNQNLGFYQILAESMPQNGRSQIDYLTSVDGLSWGVQIEGIIKPRSGEFRVGTPAIHPNNIFKVFFGSTKTGDSMGFEIKMREWRL